MADVLATEELVEEPSDYGALRPGMRLGRYELLVPIARGGMARVWAARLTGQRGFQKLVALKTILPHLACEAEFERMFLDEARIASGVHHPNVCEIYELGEDQNTLYLAMEWVNGDSFSRVLRASGRTEAVDPRVVARIVADVCAGLHAAHELEGDDGQQLCFVHRDLSPHNVLITGDGVAKVADFGVAKALGQLHEATNAGQLKGKLAYMAPEQITGAPVDRRSDIFSLGCVLYEATTGQRPFRGDGDHHVMRAVIQGEYAAPSSIVPGFPPELEKVIQRALALQPVMRFPTAERMRDALEEVLAKGPLVTQSNVAQVVRARIGPQIDRRRERIRQASSAGDREGWSEPGAGMTPSGRSYDHRSGVQPSGSRPGMATIPPLGGRPQMMPSLPLLGAVGPSIPPVPPMTTGMNPAFDVAMANGVHGANGASGSFGVPPSPHMTGSWPGMAPGAYGSYPGFPPGPDPSSMAPIVTGVPGAVSSSALPKTASIPPTSSMNPPSGPYSGPMSADPHMVDPSHVQPYGAASAAPVGAGQYAMAAGIGLLVAAIIGGGAFLAWRVRSSSVASSSASSPVAVVASSASTGGLAGAEASAVASASVSSATAPSVVAEVTFRVEPADAVIVVDGRELASDVRSVARPMDGKSVFVTARAPGHADATILVDAMTNSPVHLVLKAVDAPSIELEDEPPAPDVAKPSESKPSESKPGVAKSGVAKPESTKADAPRVDPPKETPKSDLPRPKPKSDALPANPY